MPSENGHRGLSATGVINHQECSKAAQEYPFLEPKAQTAPETLNILEQPDCTTCQESCCVAPHVTELCREDVRRLTSAGLEWAIASGDAQKNESPSLKQVDGRCVFLTPESRCSIYISRPLVCRAFPLQVVRQNESKLRFSSACRSRIPVTSSEELERMGVHARLSFEKKQSDLTTAREAPEKLIAEGIGRFFGLKQKRSSTFSSSFIEILQSKTEPDTKG